MAGIQDILNFRTLVPTTPKPKRGTDDSIYSPGLWSWDDKLSWANNITNRGTVNLQDFLGLNPQQLYGQDTGYLQDLLKGTIAGTTKNPELDKILSSGRNSISRAATEANRGINENLASSGFRGSGANLMTEVFRNRADALGGLEAQVGGMGFQARQNAIAQLLGLNQFLTGVNQQTAGQQVGVAGQLAGLGANQGALDEQVKQSQIGFGDVLTGILGTGVGAFTGGFGGSWGNSLFNPTPTTV